MLTHDEGGLRLLPPPATGRGCRNDCRPATAPRLCTGHQCPRHGTLALVRVLARHDVRDQGLVGIVDHQRVSGRAAPRRSRSAPGVCGSPAGDCRRGCASATPPDSPRLRVAPSPAPDAPRCPAPRRAAPQASVRLTLSPGAASDTGNCSSLRAAACSDGAAPARPASSVPPRSTSSARVGIAAGGWPRTPHRSSPLAKACSSATRAITLTGACRSNRSSTSDRIRFSCLSHQITGKTATPLKGMPHRPSPARSRRR